jgi:hypothetical protein
MCNVCCLGSERRAGGWEESREFVVVAMCNCGQFALWHSMHVAVGDQPCSVTVRLIV